MKSVFRLIITLLVLGLPAAYAQSAGEAEGTPFHISSRGLQVLVALYAAWGVRREACSGCAV